LHPYRHRLAVRFPARLAGRDAERRSKLRPRASFAPSWRAGSFGYKDLADKLAPTGVKETERNLSNKINRGSFTAVFFLQCMEAIGVDTLHLKG
jgi:hypothetical protein